MIWGCTCEAKVHVSDPSSPQSGSALVSVADRVSSVDCSSSWVRGVIGTMGTLPDVSQVVQDLSIMADTTESCNLPAFSLLQISSLRSGGELDESHE